MARGMQVSNELDDEEDELGFASIDDSRQGLDFIDAKNGMTPESQQIYELFIGILSWSFTRENISEACF